MSVVILNNTAVIAIGSTPIGVYVSSIVNDAGSGCIILPNNASEGEGGGEEDEALNYLPVLPEPDGSITLKDHLKIALLAPYSS